MAEHCLRLNTVKLTLSCALRRMGALWSSSAPTAVKTLALVNYVGTLLESQEEAQPLTMGALLS